MASFLRGLLQLPRMGQTMLKITSYLPSTNLSGLCKNTRLLSSFTLNTATRYSERQLLPCSAVATSLNSQALTCHYPMMQQCRTYKVRTALKRRCSACYFVRRHGRLFVECKRKPRHKQMQKLGKHKLWKEDYSIGPVRQALNWGWRKERYYWLGDTKLAKHNWLGGKIGQSL